jgi:hypothetical protein
MNIEQLRRAEQIQVHHWKAAKWFAELPANEPLLKTIEADCLSIDTRLNQYTRASKVNPYKLLVKSCVAREKIIANEITLGVLREALNVVFRIMRRVETN